MVAEKNSPTMNLNNRKSKYLLGTYYIVDTVVQFIYIIPFDFPLGGGPTFPCIVQRRKRKIKSN